MAPTNQRRSEQGGFVLSQVVVRVRSALMDPSDRRLDRVDVQDRLLSLVADVASGRTAHLSLECAERLHPERREFIGTTRQ